MIKIKNLSKNFAATRALDELNFSVKSGKITGLLGADGAGKTTLLRICAGLITPDSGSVEICGKNALEADRSKIGYMPSTFSLYPDLSCLENLRLFATLKDVKNKESRIEELLKFAGLYPFRNKMASSLSGGMKQKLSFITTILNEPEILLLDEPGVGVDPLGRAEIYALIKRLEGVSIFWATSYLDEAGEFDEIVILNEGRVLFNGTPSQALKPLKKRVFSVETNDKKRDLDRILGKDEILDAYPEGKNLRLIFKNPQNLPNEVQARFEDAFSDMVGVKTKCQSELKSLLEPSKFSGEYTISVSNLTKKFGDFTATDNISFKVKKGEIFGFLGANGAGKSTTFKMICGLLKKSGGSVEICGRDLMSAKNRIGYMAQKFSLYSDLSVLQNLQFFAGIYGVDRVREMIEIFSLDKLKNAKASSLPLGIKQRLALACSLMHSPDVLFLDEATSGVDPQTRKEFWRHISAVSQIGVSVMITTHLMDEAELCDRIMLINNGKEIASGTPEAIKESVGAKTMQEAFIAIVSASRDNTEAENKTKTDTKSSTNGDSDKNSDKNIKSKFGFKRIWSNI